MNEDVLIYDIESETFGVPNPEKDIFKFFGCYSYKTKKYYLLQKKEEIARVIKAHKFLVGFNNKGYDNPILSRFGINLEYKIIIDLMDIFKKRANSMKTKQGFLGTLLMSYSLDFITKTLELADDDTGKKQIDYSIFKKNSWTEEERKTIYEYTVRDVEITKKLYEWCENYFDSFKLFLNKEDVRKKVYLTATIGKFAYKAICKALEWEETYGDYNIKPEERISGGYVAYPAGEKFEGDIYALDFNSLYPHIMIQCNLYGRNIKDKEGWNGGKKWETEGVYKDKELSGVGQLLKKWYADRLLYKKNKDKREYTIKIILNTIYGILNNSYYSRVFDIVAGGDCTRIGRQWVKYARKQFVEKGYEVVYTDTDSVFIRDNYNNKEQLIKVKDDIIKSIKSSIPFPQDTFDMGIDDEIKYMFFFKGKNAEKGEEDMDEYDNINKPKGFMKKNYIYVTKDDRIVIKNLGIVKKSNTKLSKKIFWDYIVPQIKSKGNVKVSKLTVKRLLQELLAEDMSLMLMRKSVGPYSQYAKTSPTGITAQISKRYGAGIHFLIPNTQGVGAGKSKKYCTLKEFKERGMKIEHIDLNNVWKELDYFIEPIKERDVFSF
ncbi:hypothetical protein CMI37_29825 [Candidatus Pacearchaeota archaeon]|nr:hypothetical protein [Candidatus Pacearchaeota archaeon]|tara:strand:- start:2389 stop:4200 length:1812 start_codon:yes stop_codon:yes gene_type:complete